MIVEGRQDLMSGFLQPERSIECQQDCVPALCSLALSCSHPMWFTIAWIYRGVPCIIPFWLFVFQLGTFFLYHMWFDTMWKWCNALRDGGPNLLAFDAHSDDLMCGMSCLWYLVLVLGLGCNPLFLTWFAWLEQIFGSFVWIWLQRLQQITGGPWPIER